MNVRLVPSETDGPPRNERALEGRHVLLVEDEPLIAMEMEWTFQDAGAVVLLAHSVDAACTFLDRAMPDGAVLDVNLGQGTTCAPVAERLRDANVPFILHSGDLDRMGERIDRMGAPVVPKPAADGALVRALLEHLKR